MRQRSSSDRQPGIRRRAPPGFVEVRLPRSPAGGGVTVEIGGALLRVERAFDPAALTAVLLAMRALKERPC